MTDEKPTNLVAALAAVMSELGGIEKLTPQQRGKTGEAGVSYAYRGVDQIAAAVQPLLGKYGVVIVPRVEYQDVVELTVNGKPWTDTAVQVDWLVCGPGGPEDRITATTRGLGRDNSDKGPNKALTQAYKNLLLRLLCIGDPADDTDGDTHEADSVQRQAPVAPSEPLASAETHQSLRNAIDGLDDADKPGFAIWWKDQALPGIKSRDALTDEQAELVFDRVDKVEAARLLQGPAGEDSRPLDGGPVEPSPADTDSALAADEISGELKRTFAEAAGAPNDSSSDEEPEARNKLHQFGMLSPEEEDDAKTGGSPADARRVMDEAKARKPAGAVRGNR